MDIQTEASSHLKELAKSKKITGTIIDCCAVETSGVGCYPAFKLVDGEIKSLLSNDVGYLLHAMLDSETNHKETLPFLESLNVWFFYYRDTWTLEKIGSDQKVKFLFNETISVIEWKTNEPWKWK